MRNSESYCYSCHHHYHENLTIDKIIIPWDDLKFKTVTFATQKEVKKQYSSGINKISLTIVAKGILLPFNLNLFYDFSNFSPTGLCYSTSTSSFICFLSCISHYDQHHQIFHKLFLKCFVLLLMSLKIVVSSNSPEVYSFQSYIPGLLSWWYIFFSKKEQRWVASWK